MAPGLAYAEVSDTVAAAVPVADVAAVPGDVDADAAVDTDAVVGAAAVDAAAVDVAAGAAAVDVAVDVAAVGIADCG